MRYMFGVYSAYEPPVKRGAVRLLGEAERLARLEKSDGAANAADTLNPATATEATHDAGPDATEPPREKADLVSTFDDRQSSLPHTPLETVKEAQLLFDRMFTDTQTATIDGPFRAVSITTRLVNSLLHIYLRHAPLSLALEKFHTIYEQYGVEKSVESVVHMLERCAHGERGEERELARGSLGGLWDEWEEITGVGSKKKKEGWGSSDWLAKAAARPEGTDPRMVERAWGAMIRGLTMSVLSPYSIISYALY